MSKKTVMFPDPPFSMLTSRWTSSKVYGDHVHQNPDTHLMSGIANDALWQECWLQLVSFPSHAYNVPSSAVGNWFVERELKGVNSCKWTSKRFLVLQVYK
jgi:hypothetical protein